MDTTNLLRLYQSSNLTIKNVVSKDKKNKTILNVIINDTQIKIHVLHHWI